MRPSRPRPFLPVLRRLDGELTVPLPERLRILRELEYDLEQLRDGLVARGVEAEEARVRAQEALVPEGAVLRELARVHTPRYRRVTRSLDARRIRILERSALAVLTAAVVVGETSVLLGADLLSDPSPFLAPVLGLGGLLFAASAAKVFQLWVKGEHGTPDRGLGAILGLAGLTLAAGLGGTLVDLYRLAAMLESDPSLVGSLPSRWLVRDSALLSVSILLSLAGGLTWFVLTQWVSLVSGARREVLGYDGDARREEVSS